MTPVATPEPLSEDEAAWLMKIYTLRKKDLFYAGFFRCFLRCLPLAFTLIFAWGFLTGELWDNHATVMTSIPAFLSSAVILAVMLTTIICLFINTYMIVPYKKDAECGKKTPHNSKDTCKGVLPCHRPIFLPA